MHLKEQKTRLVPGLLFAAAWCMLLPVAPARADAGAMQEAMRADGRMRIPGAETRAPLQCRVDGAACAVQGPGGLVRDTGRAQIRRAPAPGKPQGSGVWLAGPAIPPPHENRAEPAGRAQP